MNLLNFFKKDLFRNQRTISQNGKTGPKHFPNAIIIHGHLSKQHVAIHHPLISSNKVLEAIQLAINTRRVTRTIKHHKPCLISRVPTGLHSPEHTHQHNQVTDHPASTVGLLHGHRIKDEVGAVKEDVALDSQCSIIHHSQSLNSICLLHWHHSVHWPQQC